MCSRLKWQQVFELAEVNPSKDPKGDPVILVREFGQHVIDNENLAEEIPTLLATAFTRRITREWDGKPFVAIRPVFINAHVVYVDEGIISRLTAATPVMRPKVVVVPDLPDQPQD